MGGKRGTLAERFDRHYRPHCSGCWLWTGYVDKRTGYGYINAGTIGKSLLRAHAAAYMIYKGKIPKGLDIMHSCDVRHCVYPGHLSVGTRKKNMEDCESRGRIARGFKLPQTRLTATQVKAIRRDRRKQKIIAVEYGIHSSYVSMLKSRTSRKCVL